METLESDEMECDRDLKLLGMSWDGYVDYVTRGASWSREQANNRDQALFQGLWIFVLSVMGWAHQVLESK